MSHYTVAILTKNKPSDSDIRRILAPYDENKIVPLYIANTKEEIIKTEREHLEAQKKNQYDRYVADPEAYEKEYSHAPAHIKYLKEKFLDMYNASDEILYREGIKYYEEKDISKEGQIVDTSSMEFSVKLGKPSKNIKDFLILKDKKVEAAEIIIYDDKENIVLKKIFINDLTQLSIGNLDDGNYKIVKNELAPEGALLSTYNPLSKWDWYSIGGRWSGSIPTKSDVEDCNCCQLKDIIWSVDELMKEEYIKEDYEDYKERAIRNNFSKNAIFNFKDFVEYYWKFSSYAVVDEEGNWHEPGQMLYFGMSTATDEERDSWHDNFFDKFIKGRDPETYVTLIDCHI